MKYLSHFNLTNVCRWHVKWTTVKHFVASFRTLPRVPRTACAKLIVYPFLTFAKSHYKLVCKAPGTFSPPLDTAFSPIPASDVVLYLWCEAREVGKQRHCKHSTFYPFCLFWLIWTCLVFYIVCHRLYNREEDSWIWVTGSIPESAQ
jgi:hypothetical protein